ncbi:MAG: hypothetical protein HRU22_16220 [Gammaproteobacteria bacterium]|nr:hypothetical protein [Gammaproteobacteria bacterium]
MISHCNLNIVLEGSNKGYISGDLGTGSYIAVKAMIENIPEVDTLVLKNMPGSLNMHSGRLIRGIFLVL